MTKVTKEEVLAVADRAMLAITDEEAETFTEDLATFIGLCR